MMANNDYFRLRIYGTNTSDNNGDGKLELAVGDDGTEPIYIRQYSADGTGNAFQTIKHEICLLDKSGNTSFPCSLTVTDGIFGHKFYAQHGIAGGYSFQDDDGNDTGMFSDFDGDLYFMNNSTKWWPVQGQNSTMYLSSINQTDTPARLCGSQDSQHIYFYDPSKLITGGVNGTVAAGHTYNLVYGCMADNDYFRINIGGDNTSGAGDGYVEIATADDGNEPIYVRQYDGIFTTKKREAVLLDGNGNTSFPGNVSAGGHFVGTISANDYAELFPRLLVNSKEKAYVDTNPGDLIALDLSNSEGNNKECYTLANDKSKIIVGVQSDEYAMIIGGKYTNETDNLKEFIPVSLAGRVKTRVIGKVNIGDYIIPSNIDGCGKTASKNDDLSKSVGIVVSLLDSDNTTEEEHFVKILVK